MGKHAVREKGDLMESESTMCKASDDVSVGAASVERMMQEDLMWGDNAVSHMCLPEADGIRRAVVDL